MKPTIIKLRILFARYNRLLRFAVTGLVIVLVVIAASRQFAGIKLDEIRRAAQELSVPKLLWSSLLGLACFLIAGVYDVVEDYFHDSALSKLQLLWIGWTSQAFGRFLGFGGLSGGALRLKLYRRYHSNRDNTMGYAARIWAAGLTGVCLFLMLGLPFAVGIYEPFLLLLCFLFSLYLPFYYLTGVIKIGRLNIRDSQIGRMPLREKLSLHLVSSLEWLGAFAFFAYTIRLFSPGIFLPLLLFVFVAATALGYMSFIPGGFGSFDLAAISMLGILGLEKEKVVLSLLLYRLIFFFLPFILFMIILGINSYLRFRRQRIIDFYNM
ncbi:MAG: hypothetical protein GX314_05370 [Clostridiaceae bacterium]|jgi:phosphatidylglycerol lysyltransferase|nr:hypothetical protein [Clostridiaceae bacterium]